MATLTLSSRRYHRVLVFAMAASPSCRCPNAGRLRPLTIVVKRRYCYGAFVTTDRRARRRQETIDEILDLAEAIMTEEGVNGLSLAEVARRLGVTSPSLYKYFPSLMAVYDALFARGAREHLDAMRAGMVGVTPGLGALEAALEAGGRWCL